MNIVNSLKLKDRWWIIGAIITYVASLFYSRPAFTDKGLVKDYALIPLNGGASPAIEKVVVLILINIVALSIIAAFWKGLQLLFGRSISVASLVLFCVLAVSFGIYVVSLYPGEFAIEPDANIIYAYAARKLPYYWHHILTVAFFGGCLQVIPHPIAISLVQTIFFAAAMTYGIVSSVRRHGAKGGIVAVLLLLPETFYIAFEPYRNCLSAILVLFLIWTVADIVYGKRMSGSKLFYIIPLMAVASVLRTEQMVFVPVLLAILLFKSPELGAKIRVISIAAFVALVVLLGRAQGLGGKYYFGNDYLLVSTMNPARAILNDGGNLNYEGAAEDIATINSLCPNVAVEGVLGFRTKNESEGRNIHQSLATDEQRKAYIDAYIRLVWHNKKIFVQFQINTALNALGSYNIYPLTYQYGNSDGRYESYMTEYETYERELLNSYGTSEWTQNPVRQRIYDFMTEKWLMVRRYFDATRIPIAIRFAAVIFFAVKAVTSLIACIKDKWSGWAELLLSVAILGWFAAIVVMMPESRASYFYSVTFSMYAVALEMIMRQKQKQTL